VVKLLLLDGNSLVYRAFFALPDDMATSSGQVTNAVFGFTSMLVNLLKDHSPEGLGVAFDRPEPTFRHEEVPEYKAGRQAAPDVLRQQMGLVRKLVEVMRIAIFEAPGFEADDVIATLATRAAGRGDDVVIVSGDRDVYQLVQDPSIRVLYNRRGVSDYVLYDEAGVKERTGVEPARYVDYAALRGDPSDNLPGVPGVGEKTAARLINDYGSLDGVFEHLADLSPKLREGLSASEEQVRLNAKVITLVKDAPVEQDLDAVAMRGWDPDEVRQMFNFLEFRTLWDRLVEAAGADGTGGAPPRPPQAQSVELHRVASADEAVALLSSLATSGRPVCVEAAWEGAPGRSRVLGLALVREEAGAEGGGAAGSPRPAAADWIGSEVLAKREVSDEAARTFSAAPLVAHRAKELMRGLAVMGIDVTSLELDTAIAAYLLDPAEGQYSLVDVAASYGGIEIGPSEGPQGKLDLGEEGDAASRAATRAAALRVAAPRVRAALERDGLWDLYDEIERPLVRVLAKMEEAGVRLDVGYLRELLEGLTAEARELDVEIQRLAGEPFRVNSTPQLRTILFDKLGLVPQRRTKTGYSTDATSLERLRGQHPIVEALLRYREVEKLRSTYGEGLLSEVGPDGRIHASFNQTVARTGRLSSDQPNLHNIPVRSEEGRRFRRAFVPAEGWKFLVADYNQIELRVIAHLSGDPGLVAAFSSGQDIHVATASRIFGVPPGEVTPAQRSRAKMVSYGLAYGMEAYGLSRRLAIPVEEARVILDAYFEAFPEVRSYMDATVAEARSRGYTETLFGRRRQIPELTSSNVRVRQAGERQAMNAGIQGLAADIFKVALVRLSAGLEEEGLSSRLILQVHDEVLLEVPPGEEEGASSLTTAAMCGACELSVPLVVDIAWGSSWAEAKS
jgi:DNA polymerase-1